MKRRDKREEQKQLAENAYLLRAWKRWHREQLEEALIGLHGSVLIQLMAQLKHLREARELLHFIEAHDWASIDAETRLIVLHEINAAVMRLRERNGMEPIDDPLPDQPDNLFRRIKQTLFAAPPGAHPGSNRMKQ
jgi:hypothetical protein